MELAHGEVRVDLDDQGVSAGLRRLEAEFKAEMAKISAMRAEAHIGAETRELDAKLKEAKDKVRILEGERAKVTITAEKTKFDAEIAEAQAEVKRLNGQKATITIDTRGEREALASLARVRAAEAAEARARERYAMQRQRITQGEAKARQQAERGAMRQRDFARRAELQAYKEASAVNKLQQEYMKLTDNIEKSVKAGRGKIGEAKVKADLVTKGLYIELERVKKELSLRGKHPPVGIGVDFDRSDVGRLRSTMFRIKGWAQGLANSMSGIGRTKVNIGPFSVGLRTLLVTGSALAPLLTSLLGSTVALAGVLGTGLTGAAAVAGGTMAGLALNLGGVVAAVKPAVQQFQLAQKATTAYHTAVMKYGAGSKQATTAQKQMNEVLKQVSPVVRKAAQESGKFHAEWQKLTKGPATAAIGRSLQGFYGMMNKLAPTLARNTNKSMGLISNTIASFTHRLSTPAGVHIFDSLGKSANKFLAPALSGLQSLGMVLLHVGESASRLFAGRAGNAFNAWAKGLEAATQPGAKLDATIQRLGNHAADLIHFFGALGRLLVTVFNGGANSGDKLLNSLTGVLTKWNDFLKTSQGQKQMHDFFGRAVANTKALFAALAPMIGLFVQWSNLLAPFVTGLLKGVGFVARLVAGFLRLTGLKGPLIALGATLGAIFAVSKIGAFVGAIGRVISGLRRAGGVAKGLGYLFGGGALKDFRGKGVGAGAAKAEAEAIVAAHKEGASAVATAIREAHAAGGRAAATEVASGEAAGGRVAGSEIAAAEAAGGKVAGAEIAAAEAAGGKVAGAEMATGAMGGSKGSLLLPGRGGGGGKGGFFGRALGGAAGLAKMWGWFSLFSGGMDLLGGGNVNSAIHAADPLSILGKNDPLRRGGPLERWSGSKGWGNLARDLKGLVTGGDTGTLSMKHLGDGIINVAKAAGPAAMRIALMEQNLNKQATAAINAARAQKGWAQLTGAAQQTVGQLARKDPVIARTIALKFEAPKDAAAVAAKATAAIQSGIKATKVMKIVADSKSAEEAVRRLDRFTIRKKIVDLKLNGDKQATHALHQLLGMHLPTKVLRVIGQVMDAIKKHGTVKNLPNIAKVLRMLGNNHDARIKFLQALGYKFPPKIAKMLGKDMNVRHLVAALRALQIPDKNFNITAHYRTAGNPAGAHGMRAEGGPVTPEEKRAMRETSEAERLAAAPAEQTWAADVVARADAQPARQAVSQRVNRPTLLVGEEDRTEYVIATNPAYRSSNEFYLQQAANALGYQIIPAAGGRPGNLNHREHVVRVRSSHGTSAYYDSIATTGLEGDPGWGPHSIANEDPPKELKDIFWYNGFSESQEYTSLDPNKWIGVIQGRISDWKGLRNRFQHEHDKQKFKGRYRPSSGGVRHKFGGSDQVGPMTWYFMELDRQNMELGRAQRLKTSYDRQTRDWSHDETRKAALLDAMKLADLDPHNMGTWEGKPMSFMDMVHIRSGIIGKQQKALTKQAKWYQRIMNSYRKGSYDWGFFKGRYDLAQQELQGVGVEKRDNDAMTPSTEPATKGPQTLDELIDLYNFGGQINLLNRRFAEAQVLTPGDFKDDLSWAQKLKDFYENVFRIARGERPSPTTHLKHKESDKAITEAAQAFQGATQQYESIKGQTDTTTLPTMVLANELGRLKTEFGSDIERQNVQFGPNMPGQGSVMFGGSVMPGQSTADTGGQFSTAGGLLAPARAISQVKTGSSLLYRAPTGGGGGAGPVTNVKNVDVTNNFSAPPPDHITWSRGIQYDLQF